MPFYLASTVFERFYHGMTYMSASHRKFNAVPCALPSKFTASKKPYIWSWLYCIKVKFKVKAEKTEIAFSCKTYFFKPFRKSFIFLLHWTRLRLICHLCEHSVMMCTFPVSMKNGVWQIPSAARNEAHKIFTGFYPWEGGWFLHLLIILVF